MSHSKLSWLAPAIVLVLACNALAAETRSYVAGNNAFVLGGVNCGFVGSVEGGAISAEVINEPVGPDYFVKKHIGQPKYEDFVLQIGLDMDKSVYEWIAQSWKQNYARKDGVIVATDTTMTPKSERQFFHALITETTVPAMDASSKEPAYITLKFAPEYTRNTGPSGKTPAPAGPKDERKLFLLCNFRLDIDGMDCSKVNKIDALTVKQTAVTDNIGDARDYAKEPGKLEFPNLKFTIAEAAAQPFYAWLDDFVVKGNNTEDKEKGGTLTFLSPNRQDTLAQIKFFNMGIIKVRPEKSQAGSDQISRVGVEMYVERMEFVYPGAVAGSTPPPPPKAPAQLPMRIMPRTETKRLP